jgi:hypothetical protein
MIRRMHQLVEVQKTNEQLLDKEKIVGPWLWKYAKIKEEKGECKWHGRHSDYYWVEVNKRAEKMKRSPREKVVG